MRQKMTKTDINDRKKNSAQKKMFTISVAALIFSVLVLITAVYAWFQSPFSGMGGLSTSVAKDSLKVSYKVGDGDYTDNPENIKFENILPGSKKSIFVKVENIDTKSIDITIYFLAPDTGSTDNGQEKPFINEGVYYYLGSQIKITSVKADTSEIDNAAGKYLVTTEKLNPESEFQKTGVTSAADLLRLNIAEGYTVNSDSTTIFEIEFTFVDNGEDQSIYQEQDAGFICSRRLMIEW